MVLLTWIAEVADEPLVLDPDDRQVEWETNTWRLGTEDEDRMSVSVPEAVAAFERTAATIRSRIRELDFHGVATFYVWHDEQAGQLRCSTGSVPPNELPFGGSYVHSGDLGLVIEAFLADRQPGVVTGSNLEDGQNCGEQAAARQEVTPFPVWVTSVGAASP
ncbi:hypothetical protein ACFVZD_34475 [Streptomyces sp. NPDC058287]|uniref:hypothetical protein n=1 Tax=unclassified Streptomyces TaxID=2593676 RepID=UPI0036E8DFA7